ncbi:MAG: sulfotransferase [Actinomycetota bacterium]|nr:sulfotransferase [Actinomycetota bacterium]
MTDAAAGMVKAEASAGRWPNFFIVGAPRAGTTSMWEYLRRHPDIYMATRKEPHFFSASKLRYMLEAYVSDEREYLQLFEGATGQEVVGEASTSYLSSYDAPQRIKTVSPGARILIILREPVSRAYSHHWHNVRYGREDRDFLTVVQEGLSGRRSHIVWFGHYPNFVRRYLDLLSPNVLPLVFEEFAQDARGHVRRVLEFLGVDPGYADSFDPTPRNMTALPRNALSRGVYGSRRLRSLGRSIVPGALHGRVERVLLRRVHLPRMEPEARRLLEDLYRPEVEELERVLGRVLPWRTSSRGAKDPAPTALDAAIW